jgi:hypothetical protein
LTKIVEVVGLGFGPCSNFVSFRLGDDFLLYESGKSSLDTYVIAGVVGRSELLQIVHDFRLGVFPSVDLVGLSLCDSPGFYEGC